MSFKCPKCGAINPHPSKFCNNCGVAFVAYAPVKVVSNDTALKRFGRWFSRLEVKWQAALVGAAVLGVFVFVIVGLEMEKNKPVQMVADVPIKKQGKPTSTDIGTYRNLIRSIDSKGSFIANVSEGRMAGEVKISVSSAWHYEPYQMRLQLAQNLWNTWANLYSPSEPDKARIKITDGNGNEVGGSRVWAGSLIWVKD